MNGQADDDPETGNAASLLDYTPGAPLSKMQILILDAFASGVNKGIAMIRNEIHAQLPAEIGPREVLLGLCDRGCIALSEDAWAWIDAETDPDIVDLFSMVASIPDHSETFTNLRQALMTHRELCVDLMNRANG